MANATVKLQTVVNLAATHAELMPLAGVGGYTSEPALSLCNDVIQEMLCPPFAWKCNRVEMPMLVTAPNKQDYLFAGAVAFTLGSNSQGAAIDLTTNSGITEVGNVVTVKTIEAHGFVVGDTVYQFGCALAAYNSTLTQAASSWTYSGGWVITAVTATTYTFTHASSGLATSGAAGITDYGWLESATKIEINNTSPLKNTKPLRAVRTIQPMGSVSTPEKVSVVKDLGTGVLKIRFAAVPGSTIWGANLVYQAKAPLKTDLTNDTWAPFPDELGFVYRQGFLARCYRYIESRRADVEYQKAQVAIGKALGHDDAEESDEHVSPERSLMEF
jgi:hypothetical protein